VVMFVFWMESTSYDQMSCQVSKGKSSWGGMSIKWIIEIFD
jgi:hypothetical protein